MGEDATKIGAPEFERLFDFLEDLRASGYIIETRQMMALNDLLLALAANGEMFDDFGRLKTLIAPLVCSTPTEQSDFYEQFEYWSQLIQVERAKRFAETPESSPTPPAPTVRTFPTRQVLIGLGLLALALFTIWAFPVIQTIPLSFWGQAAPFTTFMLFSVGLLLASWLGFRFWQFYQENQYITRKLDKEEPLYTKIPVKAYVQEILPAWRFKPVTSSLRRRVQIQSNEVDVEKTIENSLRHGNWVEIAYRQQQVTPEYLVLLDRKSRLDQQARFVQEVLEHLKSEGVFVHLYEFSGDPRVCFPLGQKETPLSLGELQARHPEARLLVFSGIGDLLNPLTGQPQGWLDALTHWRERAFLTPGNVNKYLQDVLQAQDFIVLPMSLNGLAALVPSFELGNAPILDHAEPAFSTILNERQLRWTGRDPLPAEEVERLLAELKTYLGEVGFYWLCACAVYPELNWELTLYLGDALKTDTKQALLNPERFLHLARLPWFRMGYMPDWFRITLINKLTPIQEENVRYSLKELLANVFRGEDFELAFSRNSAEGFDKKLDRFVKALARKSPVASSLHEYIFVKFITDPLSKKLSVQLPQALEQIKNLRFEELYETLLLTLLVDSKTQHKSKLSNSLDQIFVMRLEKEEAITYRKHWFALFSGTSARVLFIVVVACVLGSIVALLFVNFVSVFSLLFVTLFTVLGWWFYDYLAWSHFYCQITLDRIQKCEKVPFGGETRATASIKTIENIKYEIAGRLGVLFNYGTIYISIGNEILTIENIYNPQQIQQEILSSQVTHKDKQSKEVSNDFVTSIQNSNQANPFFFAGRITNPEHFVGREQELKKIFGYLNTANTGQIQHISIIGERRIGKSSLLYHISQVYEQYLPEKDKYRFIYIDLDHPRCHTQTGLLRYILEQLHLPFPHQPSLERFYDLIEQEHEKKGLWPVLLLDEFEHLSQRAAEFSDEFYETLRSLGNNNVVGLITVSQHSIQALAEQGKLTSPFFNIFHQIKLGEFSDMEARELLNPSWASNKPFSEAEFSEIFKIAGRHPARLQIVASLAYQAKASGINMDWKAIKAEAQKEVPFTNYANNSSRYYALLLNPVNWLFWLMPQYLGHAFIVLIGREKSTNETTDRAVGFMVITSTLGLLTGLISWSSLTKYISALSKLLFP